MEKPQFNKSHKLGLLLVVYYLVFFFAIVPAFERRAMAQEKTRDPKVSTVVVCVIGGAVAAIIIYTFWRLCKHVDRPPRQLPPEDNGPDPDPPPPTNAPPKITNAPPNTPTNPAPRPHMALASSQVATNLTQVQLDTGLSGTEGIGQWDISGFTNQQGFTLLMGTSFQTSDDNITWVTQGYWMGWTSTNEFDPFFEVATYDANWNLVSASSGDITKNPDMATFTLGDAMDKPRQFYRLKVPDHLFVHP